MQTVQYPEIMKYFSVLNYLYLLNSIIERSHAPNCAVLRNSPSCSSTASASGRKRIPTSLLCAVIALSVIAFIIAGAVVLYQSRKSALSRQHLYKGAYAPPSHSQNFYM